MAFWELVKLKMVSSACEQASQTLFCNAFWLLALASYVSPATGFEVCGGSPSMTCERSSILQYYFCTIPTISTYRHYLAASSNLARRMGIMTFRHMFLKVD